MNEVTIFHTTAFDAEGDPVAPRPWFETAATLLGLLALIRMLMFLLRLSLGKSRTIKAWELRATLIIWSLIAAEVLGWLDPVIAELDSIGLTEGKTRITIWSVLKAIATVTVFVVVSVWAARWIDKRITAISELAPSTRIGIGKFAYAFLIANPFPGFVGKPGTYPIEVLIDGPERQHRLKTLVRLFLAVPAFLISGTLNGVLFLVAFFGWFVGLFRGRMPLGFRNVGAWALRYGAETNAYALLLTDVYPYSGPWEFAPPRPAPAEPEPEPEPAFA